MPESLKGLKGYDASSPTANMGHLGVKTKNSFVGGPKKSANTSHK